MDRRAFIGSVAGGLLAVPLAVRAQQSGRVPRIGFLVRTSADSSLPSCRFIPARAPRPWLIEGKSIGIEYQFGDGQLSRLGRASGRARPSERGCHRHRGHAAHSSRAKSNQY